MKNLYNMSKISNSPTISVITPTYNRSSLIKRAINSVLNQTFNDFEFIIIDDCSTDNTKQIIEEFKDSRIIYHRNTKNLGCSASRNVGISMSSTKYISFIDSDDEWFPTKLEKQIRIFETEEYEIGLVYGHWKNINSKTLNENIKYAKFRGSIFEDLLCSNVVGSPSGVLIKREYLENVGKFDSQVPSTVEDWDVWLRLAKLVKFDFVPEILTITWDENDAVKLTGNHKKVVEGYLYLLEKHPEINDFYRNPKKLDRDATKDKASYIFNWGKRLICLGFKSENPKAITVGRERLYINFVINPSITSLFHYVLSLLGGKNYFEFVRLENKILKSLKSLKSFCFQRIRTRS